MSYHTWSTDGLGFCVDDIIENNDAFVSKFVGLIKKAPDLNKNFEEYLFDEYKEIDEVTINDLEEFGREFGNGVGISSLFQNIIWELEGIEFVDCDDFDHNQYILYTPSYPWIFKTCNEMDFTEEYVKNILKKYIKELTYKDIKIDYRSVENGG